LAEEKWSQAESEQDLHADMDRKQDSWVWMKEKKYASMFKKIEHRLEGVLGTGRYEWVDRRVFDQVFDQRTLLAVYKLMQQGHIDTLDWPIARGKEAHVFHATTPNGVAAVKIFHTSNAVFKSLMKYIEGDPRFGGLRRRHQELVYVWVRKEHRNMLRMANHGLSVPQPHALFRNVLVMDYLGTDEGPSPRLRDIEIPDPAAVYAELLDWLRTCWNEAGLVHADFSEYNILWHDGKPRVIDVGQAVAKAHPNSEEFLVRDVTRLVQWAQRQGVEADLAEAMAHVLDA
jgi:RIO kinase 1